MRFALAVVVAAGTLPGCSAIFDLDAPIHRDAAASDSVLDTTDAPGTDAAIDAPTQCPADYTITVAGGTTKYRLVTANAVFATHHTDCNNDWAGNTHLASLDTVAEIDALRPLVAGYVVYIGAVQAPDQTAPDVGWITFGGGALPGTRWSTAPNDTDGVENNEQNLAILAQAGMGDRAATAAQGALCECDGVPINATAENYLP